MSHETLHGQTSRRGFLPSHYVRPNVARQLRLMGTDTRKRCSDTSPRNILAFTSHRCGSVIAFTTTLIGTIVSLMASFLTSTETSLLSWKSNSDIPFAPGSKFGLFMSLLFREYLVDIGSMPLVKSPPTTTLPSSFLNRYTMLPASLHYNPGSSVYTSSGSEN